MTAAQWSRVDRVLWSYREMAAPLAALFVVVVLGFALGHGLDVIFRR